MGQSEFRLQEWLKQVDQRANEMKAKKSPSAATPSAQTTTHPRVTPMVRKSEPVPEARDRVMPSIMAGIEGVDEGVGEVRRLEVKPQNRAVATVETTDNSFLEVDEDDAVDIPRVEDHIPFLDTTPRSPTPGIELPDPSPSLSEWTGDPRPKVQVPYSQPKQTEAVQTPKARQPRASVQQAAVDAGEQLQENWNRMPKHLQILFASNGQEVAQNSYKAFRETRGELVARLLDPIISLEETARVLNVCPTTVRRYTNKGLLMHFRTAGNQRRFRLSEVLSFMDKSQPDQEAAG